MVSLPPTTCRMTAYLPTSTPVGYVDGAHSSLIDFSRTVAVGSLPIGTTALRARALPVAVTLQDPAASAGPAQRKLAVRPAATPMSNAPRAFPRCRRSINETPQ